MRPVVIAALSPMSKLSVVILGSLFTAVAVAYLMVGAMVLLDRYRNRRDARNWGAPVDDAAKVRALLAAGHLVPREKAK